MNFEFLGRSVKEKHVGLALTLLGISIVISVALYHGLTRYFLAQPDADIDFTYQALTWNAGYPLRFHPYTAHAYVILLAVWLELAAALNFIHTATIDPLVNSQRFEELYTEVMAAGRVLSIVLAIALVWAMWWVARKISSSFAAGLAAFVIAWSFGLQAQTTLMRVEMPAMLCLLIALGCTIDATREATWKSILLVGLAAFFAMTAAMIKVQTIMVLVWIPIVPLILADRPTKQAPAPSVTYLFVQAFVTIAVSFNAIQRWVDAAQAGQIWWDKAGIGFFLVLSIGLYKFVSKVSWPWILSGVMALISGSSLAFYSIYFSDNWWTPFAIVNPVQFMSFDATTASHSPLSLLNIVNMVSATLTQVLSDFFLSDTLTDRAYLFQWVYLAALIFSLLAIRSREGRLAFYLLIPGIALPAMFSLRGYAYNYFIYVEPWVALSFAVGFAKFLERKWLFAVRQSIAISFVAIALLTGALQVRYQGLAPSTASATPKSSVCCYVPYATLISDNLRPICEATSKACAFSWPDIFARQSLLRPDK